MYCNFTVAVPEVPGKIVVKKKGDSDYVFYDYERVYDAERKFNIPKRAVISKVSRKYLSLMHPNEKYQQYFPSAVLPEKRPNSYGSCCLRIGRLFLALGSRVIDTCPFIEIVVTVDEFHFSFGRSLKSLDELLSLMHIRSPC